MSEVAEPSALVLHCGVDQGRDLGAVERLVLESSAALPDFDPGGAGEGYGRSAGGRATRDSRPA